MMTETVDSAVVDSLHRRYRDAYRVAEFVVTIGSLFKGIGIVGAVVIGAGTLLLASQAPNEQFGGAFFIVGVAFAGGIGALFFLLGVLVSSVGQIQRATLDSAVNSSPFLGNEDRIRIMSLPVERTAQSATPVSVSAPATARREAPRKAHALDDIQF